MFCCELLLKYLKINLIIGLIILSVFGFLLLIPGFRGDIRNAIYEEIIKIGTPILEAHLDQIPIPDQTGNTSTPFGRLYYGVTNITLEQVKLDNSYISIKNEGATFTFCNVTIKGKADWSIKLENIIQGNGKVDIDFQGIKLATGLNLMTNDKGTLALHFIACKFKIEEVLLLFHGPIKHILNLFRSEIGEILKDVINNQTCGQIKKSLTKSANEKLKDIPLGTGIGEAVKIFIDLFSDSEVGKVPKSCQLPHPHSNIPYHGGQCNLPQNSNSPTPSTGAGCSDGQQETNSGCVKQIKVSPHLHF